MRLDKLNVYRVKLPFKTQFSTSKQRRLFSETVIVELVSERENLRGYGEGLPVDFVTGETPESVIETIRLLTSHRLFPRELETIQQIWDFVDGLPFDKKTNDATCAIELALLDLIGRGQGKYITHYFDSPFMTTKIHYGAIIPLAEKDTIMQFCDGISSLKLRQVRVKMGRDFRRNKETLELVRKTLGNDCKLTVDPNSIWDYELAIKHIPVLRELGIHTVEEPMPREEEGFEYLAKALSQAGINLMACESAISYDDVRRIVSEKLYQIINIKLSRNGGFRRCLALISLIRTSGLRFQIGCAVGESGILSAAGRALGLLCGDALCYDGSYDDYILRENITMQNVSFGYGGQAGPLLGNGLGVEVDRNRLESLSDQVESIVL